MPVFRFFFLAVLLVLSFAVHADETPQRNEQKSDSNAPESWVCQSYCGGFRGGDCGDLTRANIMGQGSTVIEAFSKMMDWCKPSNGTPFVAVGFGAKSCSLTMATIQNSCVKLTDAKK